MKIRVASIKDEDARAKELENGLRELDFRENFSGFSSTVTIPATTEVMVRNELKEIPEGFIITNHQSGNGVVTRSPNNDWDSNFLYMYNHGASEVIVTIQFLRSI